MDDADRSLGPRDSFILDRFILMVGELVVYVQRLLALKTTGVISTNLTNELSGRLSRRLVYERIKGRNKL